MKQPSQHDHPYSAGHIRSFPNAGSSGATSQERRGRRRAADEHSDGPKPAPSATEPSNTARPETDPIGLISPTRWNTDAGRSGFNWADAPGAEVGGLPSGHTEGVVLPFPPRLSIVVPTRNEAGNVVELVSSLERCVPVPAEILFVDDSDDATPAAIQAVAEEASWPVRLIHRPADQRHGGLSGAVIEGIRAARAPRVCVMDGDLQHPPEVVAQLFEEAERSGSNLVVASRYTAHGDAKGLNPLRAMISQGSTTAARAVFPNRLARVSDPMSGFFLVSKDAINVSTFQPSGFKILLEMVVRTPSLRISEVGFEFGKRHAGQSKASLREGLRYLRLLWMLRFGQGSLRFLQFGSVGASGLLVNMLLLALATEVLRIPYLLSAVLATQGSTLWNFALTDLWVFRGRRHGRSRLARAGMYFAMNNAALIPRSPIMYFLTETLSIHYMVSNLVSLVALMILRYALADTWIWKNAPTIESMEAEPAYSVAGVPALKTELRES